MRCIGGLPHAAGEACVDQVWASRLLLGPGELRAQPPTGGDHGYLVAFLDGGRTHGVGPAGVAAR
eukprot:14420394-Alexandrium_andersonii.AAC.1